MLPVNRHRVELMNEFPDAGIHAAARLRQQAIEPENIAVEEAVKIFRGRFDAVLLEHFAGDAGVRASGEFDAGGAVGNTELGFKRAAKRFHPRAVRVNQRAVNVE